MTLFIVLSCHRFISEENLSGHFFVCICGLIEWQQRTFIS